MLPGGPPGGDSAGSGRTGGFRRLVLLDGGMKHRLAASSPNPLLPQESVNRLHAQMQAFVSESQRAAELEEKRRYRFLAEKHLLLSNTFLQFFGRVSWGWGTAGRTVLGPGLSGSGLPARTSLTSPISFCASSLGIHCSLSLSLWLFLCLSVSSDTNSFIYSFMIFILFLFSHSFTNSCLYSLMCESFIFSFLLA